MSGDVPRLRSLIVEKAHKIRANEMLLVTVQSRGSGERWERVAAVVRGEEFGQVVKEGVVLLPAGGGGGEGALGESFAAV